MFEFETVQELKPNDERLEIIKAYDYTVKNVFLDKMLKEINIEYRTTTSNFANYPYIIFVSSKTMEMDVAQQNKVALYLC